MRTEFNAVEGQKMLTFPAIDRGERTNGSHLTRPDGTHPGA